MTNTRQTDNNYKTKKQTKANKTPQTNKKNVLILGGFTMDH